MLIIYNPDEQETISEIRTCGYHKQYPGIPWAGCTCFASYSQRCKKKVELSDQKIIDDLHQRFEGAWKELADN